VIGMAAAASSIDRIPEGNLSPRTGFIISLLLHLLILVGIPLLLKLTERTVSFERPSTFQLVTAPPSLSPVMSTARTAHKKIPKEILPKRAFPKSEAKPLAKEKETSETVDELASILDELPKAASVATVGEFKYTWYLDNVTRKISRYWNPPSGNSALSVLVSFTIHRDGSISDPIISKGSGDGSLDNLALRAIKLAAPFGTLPPGFSSDNLELTCTLIPTRN
jgi:TonB family protein